MSRYALFAALAWSWLDAPPVSAQIAKLLPNEVEHCQNAQGCYDAEERKR